MKADLTDINVVLDRSGSMNSIAKDTIGGFNTFLKTQQEAEGEAYITLAQFDDQYDIVYSGVPISEAPILTRDTFVPRGFTALLDAIGKTINNTGKRISDLPEDQRPSKVIFVILTDGGENSSREFTGDIIRGMIKHQTEKYSWDFIFIGANQDAITVGGNLGISANNSMTYMANALGTTSAFTSIGSKMSMYRSGALFAKGVDGQGAFFDADDRLKQTEAGA